MWQQFEAMFADSCDELFPMCLRSLPYTHVFCIIPQDKICSRLTACIVSKNGGVYHIFLFELLFIGMFAFWGTVHAIYSVHSYIYSMIRCLHLPALYHKMINGKTIYGGGSIL